jgi:hypothetical protein
MDVLILAKAAYQLFLTGKVFPAPVLFPGFIFNTVIANAVPVECDAGIGFG